MEEGDFFLMFFLLAYIAKEQPLEGIVFISLKRGKSKFQVNTEKICLVRRGAGGFLGRFCQ